MLSKTYLNIFDYFRLCSVALLMKVYILLYRSMHATPLHSQGWTCFVISGGIRL